MKLKKNHDRLSMLAGIAIGGYFAISGFVEEPTEFTVNKADLLQVELSQTTTDGEISIRSTNENEIEIITTKRFKLSHYAFCVGYLTLLFGVSSLIQRKFEKQEKETNESLVRVYKHPRYQEFLDADPENRYIYKEQTPAAFDKWLKENNANQTSLTTPNAARPTS